MTLGFFPTPYPDECLYSILCRYYARIGGAGYEKISQMLFGTRKNLSSTIYLPIKSERIDCWTQPESGITRHIIAAKHTLYPYFSISYKPELRAEVERVLKGGVPNPKHDRTMVYRSANWRLQYLRYCPLCAAENIAMYGET
ncbi:MAG: TniQ family protein, partial [Clostridiales bacterium]|nr:TniQ family protein [Clostridiales bacterium]